MLGGLRVKFQRLKSFLFPLRNLPFDLGYYLSSEQLRHIAGTQRYHEDKRLLKYGFKSFSQADEDGAIQEIFRRIGVEQRTFVEIGVGPGVETNTLFLLLQGWRGVWIEADGASVRRIARTHSRLIATGALRVVQRFVSAADIDALVGAAPLDLLSIDVDGNDYWIWQAITQARPRAVVIEYNPTLRPPVSVTMEYNPTHVWSGTSYFGASLCALERLGRTKGYTLVGCSISGVNAFFVRDDLVGDHFCAPYTAENHYEPPRFFTFRSGHRPDFGSYVEVE